MAAQRIPTCCELTAEGYTPPQILVFMYCLLYSINENTGAAPPDQGEYTSTFTNATGNGSVPAGVLGWSITAVSGTVTVQTNALPNGATTRGGGYGGKVSSAAIPYTVTGGVALVSYDVPA